LAKAQLKTKPVKLALVGAETLLGRELEDVLKDRAKDALVSTFAASGAGNFGEQEGEAVYVQPLDAEAVRGFAAILVAGSPEGALKAYDLAKQAGSRLLVIDCTGHLENQPEARIVAPLAGESITNGNWLVIIAHPAASALSLVLKRLANYRPIRQAIAHVFEPASERGKRGVSELHQQTTSLLAFRSLDKNVFDAQLSFNLLSQYGEQAPEKLSHTEQRIERDLATVLSHTEQTAAIPMPSLRLIQAPVFHGYSISLWIEFQADIAAPQIGEALASAQIEVRGQQEEAPNSVGVASQSGLIAGDVRIDPNNPRAAWLWIVGDNLRLTADAAADLVSALRSDEA